MGNRPPGGGFLMEEGRREGGTLFFEGREGKGVAFSFVYAYFGVRCMHCTYRTA